MRCTTEGDDCSIALSTIDMESGMRRGLLLILLLVAVSAAQAQERMPRGASEGELLVHIATITDDRVRIRSAPSLDAEVLGHGNTGDVVAVTARSAQAETIGDMDAYWFRVQTPSIDEGWMYGHFVRLEGQVADQAVTIEPPREYERVRFEHPHGSFSIPARMIGTINAAGFYDFYMSIVGVWASSYPSDLLLRYSWEREYSWGTSRVRRSSVTIDLQDDELVMQPSQLEEPGFGNVVNYVDGGYLIDSDQCVPGSNCEARFRFRVDIAADGSLSVDGKSFDHSGYVRLDGPGVETSAYDSFLERRDRDVEEYKPRFSIGERLKAYIESNAAELYDQIASGSSERVLSVRDDVWASEYGHIVHPTGRWQFGQGEEFARIAGQLEEYYHGGRVLSVAVNEFGRANPREILEYFGADVAVAELELESGFSVIMVFDIDADGPELRAFLIDAILI